MVAIQVPPTERHNNRAIMAATKVLVVGGDSRIYWYGTNCLLFSLGKPSPLQPSVYIRVALFQKILFKIVILHNIKRLSSKKPQKL